MKKKKREFNFFWEMPFEQKPFRDFFEPFEFRFTIPKLKFPAMNTIPVSIGDSGNKIIVRAELPGFKKDEISLNITENAVDIRAAKKREKISQTEKTFRHERTAKAINRSFTLPERVNPEKSEAKIEDGVLLVTLEKLYPEAKKKKKIEIK